MKSTFKFLVFLFAGLPAVSLAQFADSSALLAQRIKSIEKTVPLTYNEVVHKAIVVRLPKNSSQISELLGKAAFFLPDIGTILKSYGLPEELRYLPLAVSELNNQKIRQNGGSGFWQISYKNAKKQQLHISSYVDERRDYIKATHAAAKQLRELYGQYKNWNIAITAFYTDPVEVNMAMIMAGGATDYWSIHPFLKTSDQELLPAFIACMYLMNFQVEEGISPKAFVVQETDTVMVKDWLTFSQISHALNISTEDLTLWNPVYKKQVIPHAARTYVLTLPVSKIEQFKSLGDSIYRIGQKIESVDSNETGDILKKASETENPNPEPMHEATPKSGSVTVYYVIKSGDYLGLLADIFDVSIAEMRKLNNIKGEQINVNQRIKIVVPASKEAYYKGMNAKSLSEKKTIANGD